MIRLTCAVLMLLLPVAACGGPVTCAPGEVPNDVLQACVIPKECDGGVVNARNECEEISGAGAGGVGMQVSSQRSVSGAGQAGGLAAGRGGGGTRRVASGQDAAEDAGMSAQADAAGGRSAPPAGAGESGAAAAGAGGMSMPASAAPRCGNGVREGAELCDGADCDMVCTRADPKNACVGSRQEGSAATCDVHCVPTEITTCTAGDKCCPMGCNHGTDADCSPACRDGVLSGTETCEPGSKEHPCPTLADCDDGDVCTMDSVTGSAAGCSAQCAHAPLTRRAITCPDDGDPCTDEIPRESATSCTFECMSTRREPRAAPNNCADGDPCTDDTPVMSSTSCEYTCPHARLPAGTACGGGRMCTSSGQCEAPAPRCGNGVREGTETCDGDCPTICSDDGNPCTRDVVTGSAANCTAECSHPRVPPGASCPGGMCDAAGICQRHVLGTLCRGNTDCDGLQCVSGMCTRSCATDSDCPEPPIGLRSHCSTSERVCQLVECEGSTMIDENYSSTCPDGLICMRQGSLAVCLPQPCGAGLAACLGGRTCSNGICR